MSKLPKVTLVVIAYDNKILLGMKKRGFGSNKWNGFGGKPEKDESLLNCAIRETREEAGITLLPEHIEKVAIHDFHFIEKPGWDQQVHVFKADTFEGLPVETEEMRPKEFSQKAIPYDSMWVDDKYWLPHVLEGKKVRGRFAFDKVGSIAEKQVETVEELE